MRERVLEIIANQFNADVGKLSKSISFVDDLNADSIDIVELIMTIEDEFEIEIAEEDIEKMTTIGDVLDYIEDFE